MKSYEFVGKNIEKAIENGLKELNKKREDVDIIVLSEGGLFSKAKVQISFDEEEKAEVESVVEEIREEKPITDENIDKNEETNTDSSCECEDCNCGDKCDCEDCNCGEECECEDCNCNDEINKEQANEEIKKEEKEYLTSEEVIEKIQSIFSKIFDALKITGRVMVFESDEAYEVKVNGDDKVASLIGYRGEGLNAYQIIINSFIELRNKSKKILIDVENYRNRREESLKALAQRIAKKVVKTKKRHKFEPMSAYERHVIHEELANFNGVSTHSEGVEPRRCLIVEYTENKND